MFSPRAQYGLFHLGIHRRTYRPNGTDAAFGDSVFRWEEGYESLEAEGIVEAPQPGGTAARSNGRFLYVADEAKDFEGTHGAGASAVVFAPWTGAFNSLNIRRTLPLSCHSPADASGRCLVVASHGGGSHIFVGHPACGTVTIFQIDQRTGTRAACDNVISTPIPVCQWFNNTC